MPVQHGLSSQKHIEQIKKLARCDGTHIVQFIFPVDAAEYMKIYGEDMDGGWGILEHLDADYRTLIPFTLGDDDAFIAACIREIHNGNFMHAKRNTE